MSYKKVSLEDKDGENVIPVGFGGFGGGSSNSEWFTVSFSSGFGTKTITTRNGGKYTFTEKTTGTGVNVASSNRVINVVRQNVSFKTSGYQDVGLGCQNLLSGSTLWNRVLGDYFSGTAQTKRQGNYTVASGETVATALKIPTSTGNQYITFWTEAIRKRATQNKWDLYFNYQMAGVAGFADCQLEVTAKDAVSVPFLYIRGHATYVTGTSHLTVDVLEEW